MEYKGYRIVKHKQPMFKAIQTVGPGKLPNDLSGTYTNGQFAMRAIDTYLATKGTNNAKATSSRRGK